MVAERLRAFPPRPLATTLTVGAVGRLAAADAWLDYVTPSHWSRWAWQISSVECHDVDRPVRPGSTGTVHGPMGAAVSFTVTEVDATALRWTWLVEAGLLRLSMRHGVDEQAGRTRAWVEITGPLPVVVAYAPIARHSLSRLVSRGGQR